MLKYFFIGIIPCISAYDFNINNIKSVIDTQSISNLINNINNHNVDKIFINQNYRDIISTDNIIDKSIENYHLTNIDPILLPTIIETSTLNNVKIEFYKYMSNDIISLIQNGIQIILNYGLPILILFSFLNVIRNFNGANGGMPGMPGMPDLNSATINEFDYKKYNISINSWVGNPEIFEECYEVISYVKNSTAYKNLGAELPKGILLEGPPGTGKTLLAKAIAPETNSTFFSVSGSEFIELFVGMGAARIRNLFETARQNKPSIIFIDEIDTVGRQRGGNINMANDEREQTLNQLLAEMDGFKDNEDILIIGATNRKDILDQALLRPGRFDRIVKIGLPDKTAREKILEFYLEKKKTENIDIQELSYLTEGYSGADIKNLINEGAILAAREGKEFIDRKNINDAFEKLLVGIVKKTDTRNDETKRRVSIHEVGHAFMTLMYKEYFNLQKISIKATHSGAGGYTLFNDNIENDGFYTKDILFKKLVIMMGGKAAESVFYGDLFVSLGATQDLKEANLLAKKMINIFGMGNKLNVFYNEINTEYGIDKYSDKTKKMIDDETYKLVNDAYLEAKRIINENKDNFNNIVLLLLEKEILYLKDLDYFII